jgi:enoyl-CoA hydratase/carnithine racemase
LSLVRVAVLDGAVAQVVLARAGKRNAINAELAADVASAIAHVVGKGVRAVVLSADGPVFCAGADLSDLQAGGTAVDDVIDMLTSSPVHLTAVVRGPVLGAGLAVIGACPTVLATPDATFALPELNRGFFPTALMAGQIAMAGARVAYDLAFSAVPMDARRALASGLVSDVVDGERIMPLAVAHATELSARNGEGLAEGVAHWQMYARSKLLGWHRSQV